MKIKKIQIIDGNPYKMCKEALIWRGEIVLNSFAYGSEFFGRGFY